MKKTMQSHRHPHLLVASGRLVGVAALALLAAAGCGQDPNGSPVATGGAGGGAGAGAGAGTGGAGGLPMLPPLGAIVGTPLQTFDTGVSGFKFSDYTPPAGSEVNLAGASAPTVTMTTLTWDATEGSPSPGSLKVMAPFSDWNQWVEVQAATQMPLLDFTGKKLHVRLKVASGFVSDMYVMGGAQALVNTTTAYVQVNAAKSVARGDGWQEFTVDVTTATLTGFDAKMVITYGLHIYSGQGNATAAKPSPAVLFVDSFSLE